MTNAAFIYPLISATCFGISNAYWRKLEKAGFSFQEAIFYRGFIGVVLLSTLWLVLQTTGNLTTLINLDKSILSNYHWLQTLLVCIVCSLGLVCFVPSLKHKIVAVAISLSSINVFGILTAVIFLGEAFLFKHLISLAIAAIGVLLIALKSNPTTKNITFGIRSIILPLLAAFFWSVGYTLFKIPLQWMGALTLGIIIETTVWLVSIVLLVIDGKIPFAKIKNAYVKMSHFYVAGLLLVGGSLFVNIALTKISIAELNILGMFTFPITIISAFLFYKETPTIKEWIGIVLIITSILYLTLIK